MYLSGTLTLKLVLLRLLYIRVCNMLTFTALLAKPTYDKFPRKADLFFHKKDALNIKSRFLGRIKKYNSIHYKNTPIQIYRKFHLQKLKIFR